MTFPSNHRIQSEFLFTASIHPKGINRSFFLDVCHYRFRKLSFPVRDPMQSFPLFPPGRDILNISLFMISPPAFSVNLHQESLLQDDTYTTSPAIPAAFSGRGTIICKGRRNVPDKKQPAEVSFSGLRFIYSLFFSFPQQRQAGQLLRR